MRRVTFLRYGRNENPKRVRIKHGPRALIDRGSQPFVYKYQTTTCFLLCTRHALDKLRDTAPFVKLSCLELYADIQFFSTEYSLCIHFDTFSLTKLRFYVSGRIT